MVSVVLRSGGLLHGAEESEWEEMPHLKALQMLKSQSLWTLKDTEDNLQMALYRGI